MDFCLSGLSHVAGELLKAKQEGWETAELAGRGSALLIEMRQHEQEFWAMPMQKALESKRKMEDTEEELHGMRYHKSQCVRGLAKCSEMSLELPGGLVSKLELKKLAPELAKADSAHQLQLQRLAVECKERNGLCKALAAAKVAKAESSELASASKALYSSVATQLDGIISAAATLQAKLPPLPPPSFSAHDDAVAPLLPAPLYTLWHGTAAYLKAWGVTGKLVIVGDEAAARQVQRIWSGVPPGEQGGAPQSIFASHPLRVLLRLKGNQLEVGFSYHAQLQMVGVSAIPAAAATSIAGLFPSDDGNAFPDERCALRALAALGACDEAAPRLPELKALLPAKPFKWAQWLAGLGPVVAADAPAPKSFQKVMDALFALN
jgi:hypothetical protein